jgi:hypothetical protein
MLTRLYILAGFLFPLSSIEQHVEISILEVSVDTFFLQKALLSILQAQASKPHILS